MNLGPHSKLFGLHSPSNAGERLGWELLMHVTNVAGELNPA